MAKKRIPVKRAVKQLRTLLSGLQQSVEAAPVIQSLVASLSKLHAVQFNKKLPNVQFNKRNATLKFNKGQIKFNKKVPVTKFNKVVEPVKFNLYAATYQPFNLKTY
jgi:hypothetical protein